MWKPQSGNLRLPLNTILTIVINRDVAGVAKVVLLVGVGHLHGPERRVRRRLVVVLAQDGIPEPHVTGRALLRALHDVWLLCWRRLYRYKVQTYQYQGNSDETCSC